MYVTVSHASGFATDVSTVFRGRGDAVHVFSLSFAEFMSGFDGGLHEAWAQYSRYGGMPAVVALESEEEKRSRLTSFLKDACAADMVGQYGVGKTGCCKDAQIGEDFAVVLKPNMKSLSVDSVQVLIGAFLFDHEDATSSLKDSVELVGGEVGKAFFV